MRTVAKSNRFSVCIVVICYCNIEPAASVSSKLRAVLWFHFVSCECVLIIVFVSSVFFQYFFPGCSVFSPRLMVEVLLSCLRWRCVFRLWYLCERRLNVGIFRWVWWALPFTTESYATWFLYYSPFFRQLHRETTNDSFLFSDAFHAEILRLTAFSMWIGALFSYPSCTPTLFSWSNLIYGAFHGI